MKSEKVVLDAMIDMMFDLPHPVNWRVMLSAVAACLDEKQSQEEFDRKVEAFAEGLRVLKSIADSARKEGSLK